MRSAAASTHLAVAIKSFTGVHVLEADVTDCALFEVGHASTCSNLEVLFGLQAAANEAFEAVGGKLDVLIHVAALMDMKLCYLGFDH